MRTSHLILGAALLAGLSACDRSDPPSERLARAAEEMVSDVERELLPQQAEGPFAPRNECLDEPGASTFLLNFRRAVEARDADAFVALASDNIVLDFGGGAGTEELRTRLADESYDLWGALDDMLTLGCASDGEYLTLPWYFAQDIGERDPYGAYVITGSDVPLYTSPGGDEVERTIDWEMVDLVAYLEYIDPDETERWQVQLDDGTRGFVDTDSMRSLIDYRVLATREGGNWRIVSFVAGD